MASVQHAISEHDVVVLRERVGGWPAGTRGAVIGVYEDALLVEFVGAAGEMLDTAVVPAAQLRVAAH